MKREQYKKIADQMVAHIEAILEILTANEIESARLNIDSPDGYFTAELSQENNDVEIFRIKSGSRIKLRVTEEL